MCSGNLTNFRYRQDFRNFVNFLTVCMLTHVNIPTYNFKTTDIRFRQISPDFPKYHLLPKLHKAAIFPYRPEILNFIDFLKFINLLYCLKCWNFLSFLLSQKV